MKFYKCNRCGYVKTAFAYHYSVIPHYCPRCKKDMFWSGPLDDREYSLSGRKLKTTQNNEPVHQ